MDASAFSQPIPMQIGPPASQEEYLSRVQQWQQVLSSPRVQQAMEQMAQMQGLGAFAGRLATNVGQGHNPLASFGNAVETGAFEKNRAMSSALQQSLGIAKMQQGEDEFRFKRESEAADRGLAERELAMKEPYYKALTAQAARGGSGGGGVLKTDKKLELWEQAKEEAGGDENRAKVLLIQKLRAIASDDQIRALYPNLFGKTSPSKTPPPAADKNTGLQQSPATGPGLIEQIWGRMKGAAPAVGQAALSAADMIANPQPEGQGLLDKAGNAAKTVGGAISSAAEPVTAPLMRMYQYNTDPIVQETMMKVQRGIPVDRETAYYIAQYRDILPPKVWEAIALSYPDLLGSP